jgi:TrmH RNA methyltransferase
VLGLRAGLAVFQRRSGDILRVAHTRGVRGEIEALTRWAASRRIPCAEVADAELDRVAESAHHEGLCVFAKERRWASGQELADALVRARGTAIALDRVRNPYNVGAILRSAAFFGVDAALLGAPAPHPGLPSMAVRVAEGGAEHLLLARTTDLADTLGRLRARGAQIVGADGQADRSAIGFPFTRPTVLVLGNERGGLGERIRAQCDAIVAIPGSGAVESLNVAVAAGVLVAEVVRRQVGGSPA